MFAKFALAGFYRNERLIVFCKLSSNVSKDMSTCDIGLSNVLKHAAYLVLDQRDLCTNASLKDLAHASWILNLT